MMLVILISVVMVVLICLLVFPKTHKEEPYNSTFSPQIQNIKKYYDDNGLKTIADIAQYSGGGVDGLKTQIKIWEGYLLDDLWNILDKLVPLGLYMGDTPKEGAVIVAGMLSQFMLESFNFQVCDEINWGNGCNYGDCSCGQFGNDYRGPLYSYSPKCDDITVRISSADNNNNLPSWMKSGQGIMTCNTGNSDDKCCWWGRGPTQLTGRHNIKVFSNWLDVNKSTLGTLGSGESALCSNPGLICVPHSKTSEGLSIVWLSSLFYWLTQVQIYPQFKGALHTFVNGIAQPHDITIASLITTPVSWPSGIGGAINNGKWQDAGSAGNDRLCVFIRILRLLKFIPTSGQQCNINPTPPPPPKNCCTYNGLTCTTGWCNTPANCKGCGGHWVN